MQLMMTLCSWLPGLMVLSALVSAGVIPADVRPDEGEALTYFGKVCDLKKPTDCRDCALLKNGERT
ncbi:MAG: hypothetical protein OJF50_001174 [Nitrospira sp.]|jgi:hypothetical protein|nr:hypothetical protein [Nitrospira sp.]